MPYVSYTLRPESGAIDGSFNRWFMDNNDAPATVDTAGYITDGGRKGMRVGDIVTYRQWTNAPTAVATGRSNQPIDTSLYGALVAVGEFVVDTVSATAPGAVDLRDIRAMTATDTD